MHLNGNFTHTLCYYCIIASLVSLLAPILCIGTTKTCLLGWKTCKNGYMCTAAICATKSWHTPCTYICVATACDWNFFLWSCFMFMTLLCMAIPNSPMPESSFFLRSDIFVKHRNKCILMTVESLLLAQSTIVCINCRRLKFAQTQRGEVRDVFGPARLIQD